MKKVFLTSVLLKSEQRPQTLVFSSIESLMKYRDENPIIQFTVQEVFYIE